MHHQLKPQGVCPHKITFDLEGNVLHNVQFHGGCPGNLQAISRAVEGMTVERLEQLFRGIDCGGRGTSCSDQLAALVRRTFDAQSAENPADGLRTSVQ